MVNDIITGVFKRINEVFEDECGIYTEHATQSLKEPYFYIACLNSVDRPMSGKRHLRVNVFSVKYFPKSKTEPNAECNTVSDNLFLALEYITVKGALVQGTNMNSKFVDGALEFMVEYSLFVQAVLENEPMETLTLTNSVKRGGESNGKT